MKTKLTQMKYLNIIPALFLIANILAVSFSDSLFAQGFRYTFCETFLCGFFHNNMAFEAYYQLSRETSFACGQIFGLVISVVLHFVVILIPFAVQDFVKNSQPNDG